MLDGLKHDHDLRDEREVEAEKKALGDKADPNEPNVNKPEK